MRLSVIMPCYNEAATLSTILAKVREVDLEKQIIAVDDNSSDNTYQILCREAASDPTMTIIRHPNNRGKGAAVRSGLARAVGEIVIVQDADLEYDPQDWPALLQPIIDGKADACFGSRFLGGPHRVLYYWHSVGNRILTTYCNMLVNLNLTDMETCYKAVRGELARSLVLTSDRFGFEPEITARLAQRDARIFEVPISYAGRTYAEGKKINWKDGLAAFWHITKFALIR
jgi:glycosyltransferase involved in cell wall biosynthesis